MSTHDDVRELQANMGYWVAVVDKKHKYAKLVEEEMGCYRDAVDKMHEKAEKDGDHSELGKHGPPSTHIFVRLLTEMTGEKVEEKENEAGRHMGQLKELLVKFEMCELEEATQLVGTFKINRSQKMLEIITMMT